MAKRSDMTKVNKVDKTAQLTTCIDGVNANFPASQTWVFNGKTYKRSDFVNLVQACIDATKQTAADHQTWLASADAEQAQYAQLSPVLAAFKRSLESQYGPTSKTLAQYGFEPAKVPVKPVAVKAASAAKASATRQKKKAAVEGVEVEAPANEAPAATPAPTTPVPPKTA